MANSIVGGVGPKSMPIHTMGTEWSSGRVVANLIVAIIGSVFLARSGERDFLANSGSSCDTIR